MTFNRTRDDIRIHTHANPYEGGPIKLSAIVGDDGGPITIITSSEFPDDEFYIVGSVSPTKRARFEVDGFTANTDRTFTLPDASMTVAGINLAQSWSALQKFPDDMIQVVGSADVTKIARFEVDGITTATTRTLTVQNASYTLAGINLAQSWSALQKFPDNMFQIVGSANAAKILAFEVDGLTATTRTLTPQDASYIIAGTNISNTFTAVQTINPASGTTGLTIETGSLSTNAFAITQGGTQRMFLDVSAGLAIATNGDTSASLIGQVAIAFNGANFSLYEDVLGASAFNFQSPTVNRYTRFGGCTDISAARTVRVPNSDGTLVVWNAGVGLGAQPLAGSLLYGGGATTPMAELAIGASGLVLTSSGTAPQWSTAASVVDVARSWTTLQTFPDNTFKIVGSASANRTLVFEVDAASANADLILNWAGTADRTLTFPDTTTTLAGLATIQTFTAAQTIAPGTDVVGLTVTQNVGATASMQTWQRSDGTDQALIDIDGAGQFSDMGSGGVGIWQGGNVGDAGANVAKLLVTNLTADRNFEFADASGTIIIGGATATLDLLSGTTFRSNTASSGANFEDNSTTSKKLRMVLSGGTGNNSFTFTNATRAMNFGFLGLSGNVVTVGDDPPAVAAGNLGKVDLTGQTANIGTTNLSNTPPAGLYVVEVVLECTTSAVAAGTLAVTIGWTDTVGATTDATSITAFPLTATGRTSATYRIQVASGDITYATTVTGIYSTSAYAIYVRVISLA